MAAELQNIAAKVKVFLNRVKRLLLIALGIYIIAGQDGLHTRSSY